MKEMFQVAAQIKGLINNKSRIKKHFANYDKRILSIKDLGNILNDFIYEELSLSKKITRSKFEGFLVENEIAKKIEIELPKKTTTKYTFTDVSDYEIALSLNPNSYLSHYTAMFLHGLTDNVPKIIYTNTEQFKKSVDNSGPMQQVNIDRAFSRPMRKTNNIAQFDDLEVVLLNGKNVDRLEVITININGVELPITSIERTLIDIVTRPYYAGGVEEILNAYKEAQGRFSTGRLLATLKNFNYKYPYHQAIGFYLEKAGYDETILKRFDKLDKPYDFYLTYQMKDKSYSTRWKLYYPKYLV